MDTMARRATVGAISLRGGLVAVIDETNYNDGMLLHQLYTQRLHRLVPPRVTLSCLYVRLSRAFTLRRAAPRDSVACTRPAPRAHCDSHIRQSR